MTVTETTGGADRVIAKGVLHILPADFLKQMTTMEVTGATMPLEKLQGLAKFGLFFAGALFETYGGVFVSRTSCARKASRANVVRSRCPCRKCISSRPTTASS